MQDKIEELGTKVEGPDSVILTNVSVHGPAGLEVKLYFLDSADFPNRAAVAAQYSNLFTDMPKLFGDMRETDQIDFREKLVENTLFDLEDWAFVSGQANLGKEPPC